MTRSKSNSRRHRTYQLAAVLLIAVATVTVGGVATADAQSSAEYDYTLVQLYPSGNFATHPDTVSVTLSNDTESQQYTLNHSELWDGSVDYASIQSDITNPSVTSVTNLSLSGTEVRARSTQPLIRRLYLDDPTSVADVSISTSQPIDWTEQSISIRAANGQPFGDDITPGMSTSGFTNETEITLTANTSELNELQDDDLGPYIDVLVRPSDSAVQYYDISSVSTTSGPLLGGGGGSGGSGLLILIVLLVWGYLYRK